MTNKKFKGVWIPKEIWLDNNLTLMEKHFLSEIKSLDKHNECFASNKYFADFFKVTPQRASQVINSLINKKILSAQYEHKDKWVTKRVLNIIDTYKENLIGGYKENSHRGIKKIYRGYKENVEGINTYNNTDITVNKDAAPISFDFFKIWNKYLRKIGMESARKSFTTSVKTEQDWADINKALANYNESVRGADGKFIQYGSTWFKSWRDWVDYKQEKKYHYTKYQDHEHFIDKDYDIEKAKAEAKADGFNVFDEEEEKLKEEKKNG